MTCTVSPHPPAGPSRPSISSTSRPTDLPSALALLERRSIQNEALRQQKRCVRLEEEMRLMMVLLRLIRLLAGMSSSGLQAAPIRVLSA